MFANQKLNLHLQFKKWKTQAQMNTISKNLSESQKKDFLQNLLKFLKFSEKENLRKTLQKFHSNS